MRKYFYRLATDEAKGPLAAFLKTVLLLFSMIYGIFVRVIFWGYKKNIFIILGLPKPVISVGNITWGGVGKTPLVAFIAEYLKQQGLKPAILSRGYMVRSSKIFSREPFSDEVTLLKATVDVPVGVGSNRLVSGEKILKENPTDVFILDDGFQYWRLKRDLDIVVVDSTRPFGNGCLIPRGILREPLDHLHRAQVFVLTKTDLGKDNLQDLKGQLNTIQPKALIVEALHQPISLINVLKDQAEENLSFLENRLLCCFSSIGDPLSFEKMLTNLGARIKRHFVFMDHYVYTPSDIQIITDFCRKHNIDSIVTTHKDAVKLRPFFHDFKDLEHVLYLKIKIQMTEGQDAFFDRIHSVCHR